MRYENLSITGVANSETEASQTLQTTQAEPKKLVGLMLTVSDYQGNSIIVYKDQTKIATIYDYLIDTFGNDGDTSTPYSTNKEKYIEFDEDLELGDEVTVALNCGANNTNLFGAFVYKTK